jgi:D-alanyl-D-alanine carboxypeptidase (penicillin-binding protein 5/6)
MAMRWLAAVVATLLIAPTAGGAVRPVPVPPAPGPVAAILMDVRTGQVLFARDIHRRWPPASTTKILTAIVAIERVSPDLMVTIGPRAAAQRSGSAIGLEVGERWRLEDLLLAMMVRSANDAAVAVAEAVGGGVERFVGIMNAEARLIGARDSRFVNPHGLDDPNHYSSAHDLAAIARYALHHPRFAALVRRETWTLARDDRPPQIFSNSNRLLTRYAGADGVKTGWTAASGHTLVASATRDGWQLIAVVLHSRDLYGDAEQLLDYGFYGFLPLRVAERGEVVATVPVGQRRTPLPAVVPADIHAVVRKGTEVRSHVRMRADLRPPIRAGAPVGTVEFRAGDSVVARSVLVAGQSVAR